MKTWIYVGIRGTPERDREVFRSPHRHDLHAGLVPGPFVACIGPFRTMRAARLMASRAAEGNPHLRCVADAERIAKATS